MNFDDIGLEDLTREEKIAYILHAMDEAKLIVGSAMELISTGVIPKNQTDGWNMLSLLVRQKEKELEYYLDDEED
jgi:hypothetical protein